MHWLNSAFLPSPFQLPAPLHPQWASEQGDCRDKEEESQGWSSAELQKYRHGQFPELLKYI